MDCADAEQVCFVCLCREILMLLCILGHANARYCCCCTCWRGVGSGVGVATAGLGRIGRGSSVRAQPTLAAAHAVSGVLALAKYIYMSQVSPFSPNRCSALQIQIYTHINRARYLKGLMCGLFSIYARIICFNCCGITSQNRAYLN